MTIFGLNSPEIFVILLILLVILGTKRIEIGLNLFSKLLKFLLNNRNNSNKVDKKKEPIKDIEETKAKEEESEKRLKISNVENKGKNSITTNVPKGIKKDKTVNKLKTKVPKRILKEKTARKSKTINQEEQQDK